MRLQLIAPFLVMTVATAHAEPDQSELSATVRVYADDDDMTVVSPSLRAAGLAVAGLELEVDATVDAVTGASVDVVSSASPRAIDERRAELGVAALRPVPVADAATLSLDARVSHERDYLAVGAGAGARIELDARNLVIELDYRIGHDRIGDATDPSFHRTRRRHDIVVAATRILGVRTIADVALELSTSTGYHASPYRLVPVVDPAAPLATWVDEATPSGRRHGAAAVRLRRALGGAWFVSGGYRGYADDWSIASHTADATLHWQVSERLLVGGAVRGYLQGAADFYQATYLATEPPGERTRDRTLGPMRTLFGSVTAALAFDDDRWHLVGSVGVLSSWFLDFPAQADRHALVTTLSLSLAR